MATKSFWRGFPKSYGKLEKIEIEKFVDIIKNQVTKTSYWSSLNYYQNRRFIDKYAKSLKLSEIYIRFIMRHYAVNKSHEKKPIVVFPYVQIGDDRFCLYDMDYYKMSRGNNIALLVRSDKLDFYKIYLTIEKIRKNKRKKYPSDIWEMCNENWIM